MFRLIEADLASTGKPHLRNGTPSFFLNFRALNILLREGSHFGFQIVAHKIEFVDAIFIGWVERGFCRRQGEDQPAMTRIHGSESEDVAEKCAVRLGVFDVDNYVSARNHLSLLKKCLELPSMFRRTTKTRSRFNKDTTRESIQSRTLSIRAYGITCKKRDTIAFFWCLFVNNARFSPS